MKPAVKLAVGVGLLFGVFAVTRPKQANQVTAGSGGGSGGGLFAFGGGQPTYAGENASQPTNYNVMVESPSLDMGFMANTMAEPTKKETETRSSGGSTRGVVLDFKRGMTTTQTADIFTPTSASASDRFVQYGDSGAIADRHAQASMTFEEASKRASTPNFRDFLASSTKKETVSFTPAGI